MGHVERIRETHAGIRSSTRTLSHHPPPPVSGVHVDEKKTLTEGIFTSGCDEPLLEEPPILNMFPCTESYTITILYPAACAFSTWSGVTSTAARGSRKIRKHGWEGGGGSTGKCLSATDWMAPFKGGARSGRAALNGAQFSGGFPSLCCASVR